MSTIQPSSRDWTPPLPIPPTARMNEEAFLVWCPCETRNEWVDGEVIVMSPVNIEHSDITTWLIRILSDYVEARTLGKVIGGDFLVRNAARPSLRVPDLFFVTTERLHLINRTMLEGAPDLIVEVVSSESIARDWREKYLEYEAAGVCEYWVIDTQAQRWDAYALGRDGKYTLIPPTDGKVASVVLAGLELPVAWMWAETRPSVREARKLQGID